MRIRNLGPTAVTRYEAAIGEACHQTDRGGWGYETVGRTALWWRGIGAVRLGLHDWVSREQYRAVFGEGGCCDPVSGRRLVQVRVPGFVFVIAVNQTVALLDVIGRPDHAHTVLDAQADATMRWLEGWFQERGGHRGQTRTPTTGLTYATTRTISSRGRHVSVGDHVLIANIVELLDDDGGFRALDRTALAAIAETATMVGRLAGAARAIKLGYGIEPVPGPTGRRRDWRIIGVPQRACTISVSRRDIRAAGTRGSVGAGEIRSAYRKRLAAIGLPVEQIESRLNHASTRPVQKGPRPITDDQLDWIAADLFGRNGPLDHRDFFTPSRLIAELVPRLYGHDPRSLNHAVDHLLRSPHVVRLEPLRSAREPTYGLAHRYRHRTAS